MYTLPDIFLVNCIVRRVCTLGLSLLIHISHLCLEYKFYGSQGQYVPLGLNMDFFKSKFPASQSSSYFEKFIFVWFLEREKYFSSERSWKEPIICLSFAGKGKKKHDILAWLLHQWFWIFNITQIKRRVKLESWCWWCGEDLAVLETVELAESQIIMLLTYNDKSTRGSGEIM